ncbi:hypothetical protein GE118_03625 [Mycoplasma sp. NEAQ87857]|uniref:hypothetical protein n=1 Tax=Mycoplasma sp. NEAQ87857 TaxID=2683967 RepID=UPI001315AEE6|nr:hypothetical protein [Mycoplasma sp. NEAQ87857]QGZ97250.1 hypothetical protein GE118_00330 [Mycoplasma sp. NEAQ87857]QGZ97872.1 hypothetical protein GE118_03625 [Mycoplasma sp. NEAQ87857]
MTLEQLKNLKLSLIDFRTAEQNYFTKDFLKEFLDKNQKYDKFKNTILKDKIDDDIIWELINYDVNAFYKLFLSLKDKWYPNENIYVYQDENGNDIVVDGNRRVLILKFLYQKEKYQDIFDFGFTTIEEDIDKLDEINEYLKNVENNIINEVNIKYIDKTLINNIVSNNIFTPEINLKTTYNKGIYLSNVFTSMVENNIKTLDELAKYKDYIFNKFGKTIKEFYKDYKESCFLYQAFSQSEWSYEKDYSTLETRLSFQRKNDLYKDYSNVYKTYFHEFCYENKVSKYSKSNLNTFLNIGYSNLKVKNAYNLKEIIDLEFDSEQRMWVNKHKADDDVKTNSIFEFLIKLDEKDLLKTTKNINFELVGDIFFATIQFKRKDFALVDVIQDIFKFNNKNLYKLSKLIKKTNIETNDLIRDKRLMNDEINNMCEYSVKFKGETFINEILKQNEELIINNNFQFNVIYSNLRNLSQYIINIIFIDYLTFLIESCKNNITFSYSNDNITYVADNNALDSSSKQLNSIVKLLNWFRSLGIIYLDEFNMNEVLNMELVKNIIKGFIGEYSIFSIITQKVPGKSFYKNVVLDNDHINKYVLHKFKIDFDKTLNGLIKHTQTVFNKWVHCAFILNKQQKYDNLPDFLAYNIESYKFIVEILQNLDSNNFIQVSTRVFNTNWKLNFPKFKK